MSKREDLKQYPTSAAVSNRAGRGDRRPHHPAAPPSSSLSRHVTVNNLCAEEINLLTLETLLSRRFLPKIDAGVFNQQLLTWMKSAKVYAFVKNVTMGLFFCCQNLSMFPGE